MQTRILNNWVEMLEQLGSTIAGVSSDNDWVGADILDCALKNTVANLDRDLKKISREEFIFSQNIAVNEATQQNANYLRRWHVLGDAPSLTALAIAAMQEFNITEADFTHAVLMATILGEVEHDQPYHNNNHFRKVLLQTIRVIGAHNNIYSGTELELNTQQIALLLSAAAIHDLGHDGTGNTLEGVHQPSRLELRSFELAKPYLEAAGLQGQEYFDLLKVLLVATDVSPMNDPKSPTNQMKSAYRFHFMGEDKNFHRIHLSSDLRILEKDKSAALMACLLQEADIATSAGLAYEVTEFESASIFKEMEIEEVRPQQIINFLNDICQKSFLSGAGQKLYGENITRIYLQAEKAVQDGNDIIPKPDHTGFILSFGASPSSTHPPETLN